MSGDAVFTVSVQRDAIARFVCDQYRANKSYNAIQQSLRDQLGVERSLRTLRNYVSASVSPEEMRVHMAAINASRRGPRRPTALPVAQQSSAGALDFEAMMRGGLSQRELVDANTPGL